MEENIILYKKLTPLEQRQKLKEFSGWTIENERLEKEYLFSDFVSAMIFLNKIINPIEENQNYPRITITYNRVHTSLFTNQAGCVTQNDFDLAKSFDELSGLKTEALPKGVIKA